MTDRPDPAAGPIGELLAVMRALRTPGTGCPWDLEQDFSTIAPYTVEEAHEVAEAIARGDMADLKDELGDLLLQVVFHSQMAAEDGAFAFADVVEGIRAKMIRRHPHVFADANAADADAVTANWDAIKAEERRARGKASAGRLDGVPEGLPALMRAEKLQKKAAKAGFDWPDAAGVLAKLDEEIGELREAAATGETARIKDELGDVLFVLANLARRYDIDAEGALRGTNAKFTRRFQDMERLAAAEGAALEALDLDAQEALYQRAKARERAP
ncbi:MAG: nucleoside triphosphate pyrophosphohydrolase [Alphaproteobacteria bacterium]|nr:nucleoside triphosphate pyrophosphohydrolase [Alphaproteobacteria bacterium]